MKFQRLVLPYELDSLEPYISKKTMNLHYNMHHAGYEAGVNGALEKITSLPSNIVDLRSLMTNYFRIKNEPGVVGTIRRMGGGLINHDFFFSILKKNVSLKPEMPFYEGLIKHFEDFNNFKEIFVRHAKSLFGSGWVWLAVNNKGQFKIFSTENQDNPWLKRYVVEPVLGIDVWEHAYYIDYQNRRAEYIEAFFNVIDWEKVNELYLKALKKVDSLNQS